MSQNALFKLSYGLFVLTARKDGKDNGCIVNTVCQVTDNPERITVTVNKSNLTHDMIMDTGVFNVSVIAENGKWELFKRFGFSSGKNTDKFEDFDGFIISKNGFAYVYEGVNAVISAEVEQKIDLGTHTQFICKITDKFCLNDNKSMTYQYYFDNVKPKPEKKSKGYVCKICGYVYEGDTLPENFVCPICKHGAADFEKI